MRSARSHFAVAAYGGRIYVFGGGGEDFKSLNSTEIYDPQTDRWDKARDMPTIRSGAVAAVLKGRIYVMGGGFRHPDGQFEFFKTVEIYDPPTDTWTEGPEMLMPHDFPASVTLNGRVYVMGGHHPDATRGGPMTDPGFSFCEVFDPSTVTWHEITPMPTPRFAFAAVILGNKILALGGAGLRKEGFKNFDVVETYDPDTNKWADAGFKLLWPAAGLGAFAHNSRLYALGGNSGARIENRFAYYDPAINKWIELESLWEGRIVMGVAFIDDTLYVIGGRGLDGKKPLATVSSHRLTY